MALAITLIGACAQAVPVPTTELDPHQPQPTNPWLLTGSPPDSLECPAALLSGILVIHPDSGLGVAGSGDGDGETVIWPFGFSAGVTPLGASLLDRQGRVIAIVGESVEMSGGELGDGIFKVCPAEVHKLSPGLPEPRPPGN